LRHCIWHIYVSYVSLSICRKSKRCLVITKTK
jgi:hypothetical protein